MNGVKRWQALGRLPKQQMNNTEAAYAKVLEARRVAGEVLFWKFHPMNVRLAGGCFYEVDFLVMTAEMTLEIHEVKGGYTSEKGQIKIKLAAQALPIFRMVKVTKQAKKDGGGWKYEDF